MWGWEYMCSQAGVKTKNNKKKQERLVCPHGPQTVLTEKRVSLKNSFLTRVDCKARWLKHHDASVFPQPIFYFILFFWHIRNHNKMQKKVTLSYAAGEMTLRWEWPWTHHEEQHFGSPTNNVGHHGATRLHKTNRNQTVMFLRKKKNNEYKGAVRWKTWAQLWQVDWLW